MSTPAIDHGALPYRIAVLCYLADADGRLLLLHRSRPPNAGLYSPIGGKLEVEVGESPHACAIREIHEEAGVELNDEDVQLLGIISEAAYEDETHWLLFLFEVNRPVAHEEIAEMSMDEGELEWIPPEEIRTLEIPDTDRQVMWPLVEEFRGGGFFMAHIDCRGGAMEWTVQERRAP